VTVPELSYFLWGALFEQGPAMGLILNVVMSFAALLSGILLGIPVGLLRVIAPIWLKAPITLLITLIRSTPLLLLVLWLFLLIQVVFALPLDPLWIGCIALSLYAMTHLSDLVRAGAKAVPKQQVKAAASLGLNQTQIGCYLLLPYALRSMFPAICTFFTSLFKDSSVCYVIGVIELMQLGVLESARHPQNLLINYAFIALIFFTISTTSMRLAYRIEQHIRVKGMQG
jgi:polar amino acid transport system permease protein